jgi:hypothetical protein
MAVEKSKLQSYKNAEIVQKGTAATKNTQKILWHNYFFSTFAHSFH